MPPEMANFKPKDSEYWHGRYRRPKTSWRYAELETAKFWGLTPWTFDGCPTEEKAEMIAQMNVSRLIEAYQYEALDAHSKASDTGRQRNLKD